MIEVESQDFNIKLVCNTTNQYKTTSNYVILLAGYGRGESEQNFFDVIKTDNNLAPFYSLLHIYNYSEELASFWRSKR